MEVIAWHRVERVNERAVVAARDDMIEKVKALWARADHPNTPEPEARACREKAAEMMAKYEIDMIVLAVEEHGEPAIVFGLLRLENFDKPLPYVDERQILAGVIARNFECRIVITTKHNPSADEITGEPLEPGIFAEICGYQHDFEMVKALYFNLVVDMLAGTFAEKQQNSNYLVQFCRGYVARIDDRLAEMLRRVEAFDPESVSSSVAVAIRSRKERIMDKFNEKYPPGSLGKAQVKSSRYDPSAQARGRARANAADLGGGGKIGGGEGRTGIGQARKELR